jgi:hypothetical protein
VEVETPRERVIWKGGQSSEDDSGRVMSLCHCDVGGSDSCGVCDRCESRCNCAVLFGLRTVVWKRSAAVGVSEADQCQWVSRAEIEAEEAIADGGGCDTVLVKTVGGSECETAGGGLEEAAQCQCGLS